MELRTFRNAGAVTVLSTSSIFRTISVDWAEYPALTSGARNIFRELHAERIVVSLRQSVANTTGASLRIRNLDRILPPYCGDVQIFGRNRNPDVARKGF